MWSILEAADGSLWFGTQGDVSRLEGTTWRTITPQDGLADNWVNSIQEAADGSLWFGTSGGVSRLEGTTWRTITFQDGLAGNSVSSIQEAADGSLWFGTEAGGVSRFQRPQHSRANTAITSTPPARFGASRFYFEFGRGEFGTHRPPPVSYALVRGTEDPSEEAWSPFEDINGYDAPNMTNGTWTLYARTIDRYGLLDPTPASTTFTVDITAPTVIISAPTDRQPVQGRVGIIGSVDDQSAQPDLMNYALAYAPGSDADAIPANAWQTDRIEALATDRVLDDTLAVWNTAGLHGPYLLRISAEDSLHHLSQTAVRVQVVSAVQQVDKAAGGHLGDAENRIALYLPPNSLPQAAQVTITPDENPTLLADPSRQQAGPIVALAPDSLHLQKPATLGLAPDPAWADPEGHLALFAWSDSDETWQRVGGTLDPETGQIRAAIHHLGTYGLFSGGDAQDHGPPLGELTCQPRLIAPRGGGFAEQMDISFHLGRTSSASVRIFDAAGHLVRELLDGAPLGAGSNVLTWDGRDQDGRLLYEGAYIVVVEANGRTAQQIVALVDSQR